jgi:DNA-binding MarR family transcriptional regulator
MAKSGSGEKRSVQGLERSPSHLLHRAAQLAADAYAAEFGVGSLTQRQYALLAASAEHEGATQADLVRITGIDRSTLADMTARMMSKGLLERQRSDRDGRANAVRPSAAGHEALLSAAPKMESADARLLKLLSRRSRRKALLELLVEMVETAEKAAEKRAAKARRAAKRPQLELVAGTEPEPAPKKPRKKDRKAA